MIGQPTRHFDKLVVVQMKFPQMRSVGQRAIVNRRDAVETQSQPATENRNEWIHCTWMPSHNRKGIFLFRFCTYCYLCLMWFFPNYLSVDRAHLFLRFQLRQSAPSECSYSTLLSPSCNTQGTLYLCVLLWEKWLSCISGTNPELDVIKSWLYNGCS